MRTKRCIPLFGSPPFMDTVEAYLSDMPDVDVVRIHPSVPDIASRIQSLQPEMIIVDLNAPNLGFVAAVLQEQPAVPIFCIDVTCSKMVVLTGRHYTIATVDDLLAIVDHYIQGWARGGSEPQWPDVAQMITQELVDTRTEGER